MASKLQFLVFPAEILIMMLQNLGYKDLITSSMVCKRFYKLVKEAIVLSYIIELGVDGLADGPPSNLSTTERLRFLLDRRRRWRTFDWVKRERVNPYPTRRKEDNKHYAQGIFSQEMSLSSEGHLTSIFHTMLPTRATEATEFLASLYRMARLDSNPSWLIRNFLFLSSRSFVLYAALWNGRAPVEHALLLFTFCDESSDGVPWTITTGSVKHIVTLMLPELAEGQNTGNSLIETTPCTSYQPRGVPFKVDDPSRILVYDAWADIDQETVRMVVHTDVFKNAKNLLSSAGSTATVHPRRIPWDAWGPEYTRLFMADAPFYFSDLPSPIHGERTVMQMTEAGEETAYLMDFNRRAHRRQMSSGLDDTALITEPSILPPSLFANPVTTSLPYTAIRIPNADSYNGFLLDEQRLIGLKDYRPTQKLDVFVF